MPPWKLYPPCCLCLANLSEGGEPCPLEQQVALPSEQIFVHQDCLQWLLQNIDEASRDEITSKIRYLHYALTPILGEDLATYICRDLHEIPRQPSPLDKLRTSSVEMSLTNELLFRFQDLPKSIALPAELLRMIGSYMPGCPFAYIPIIANETVHLLKQCRMPSTEDISLALPVYATFVIFGGCKQLSKLTNKKEDNYSIQLKNQGSLKKLVFEYNSVGIVNADFTTSEHQKPPDVNTRLRRPLESWYIAVDVSERKSLSVTSDGLFVSDIAGLKNKAISWNTTTPPTIQEHSIFWEHLEARMFCYTPLREGCRGLIISCKDVIETIHAYDPKVPFRAYDTDRNDIVWIYVPLAEDERICGTWVISRWHPYDLILAIVTNTERLITVGQYIDLGKHVEYTFNDLVQSEDASVISFGCSSQPHGIAVELDKIVESPRQRNLTLPLSRTRCPFKNIKSFYSRAHLEGVRAVQLCTDPSDHTCIGILFSYEDHEVTLGQWRFDYPMSENVPTPCTLAYLRTGHQTEAKIGDDIPDRWISYRLPGTPSSWLEGWFYAHALVLRHYSEEEAVERRKKMMGMI